MNDIDITGVVLAGGRSRRMGGQDKAWVVLEGQPLLLRVLARLAPQVGEVWINLAPGSTPARYQALGVRVIHDALGPDWGPLAGLHATMTHAVTPWVASVPCDCPFLPRDLICRLAAGLVAHQAQVAIPRAAGRLQPTFCLADRGLQAGLTHSLQRGVRRIEDWLAGVRHVVVPFEDEAQAFFNINRPEDLGHHPPPP